MVTKNQLKEVFSDPKGHEIKISVKKNAAYLHLNGSEEGVPLEKYFIDLTGLPIPKGEYILEHHPRADEHHTRRKYPSYAGDLRLMKNEKLIDLGGANIRIDSTYFEKNRLQQTG